MNEHLTFESLMFGIRILEMVSFGILKFFNFKNELLKLAIFNIS